ncbi:glycosyltransferase family 2 protein [Algoriphagus winogradskyi]|jgi:glycosyltransferase involved in cell wall biosynthesis|uniref:Glycosyltransferase involved in cell wall bisynthesis n=1 Tax=Algoriphagus winogradskyi TaxID=237017 RepID=A0ABY1NX72_9BACT|nr:glycosyltransferase family 2 protein [Algoriphagus winogradskyi]SMP19898.1 Glycosyltransferase involved in cell wall bisynthesis [Algoriphagus winogradskyi]
MVSAIVPVFNAEKTLVKSVESVLLQPEIDEIFLVDDGSKDKSLELCHHLASKYPIINVLQHPDGKNKGAPASRNLGLSQCKNKWVQFQDADDELLPDKIKKQLECLDEESSFLVGSFFFQKEGKREFQNYLTDPWSGLLGIKLGNSISNLYNGDLIKQIGGWRENLPNMQEYHLMFDLMKVNPKVSFCAEPLAVMIFRKTSITHTDKNRKIKQNNYFTYRRKVREYLESIGEFSLIRRHYYHISTGNNLSYHKPPFEVEINKLYYNLYKKVKGLKSVLG